MKDPTPNRFERASFTMPAEDLARIQMVRQRVARHGEIYPKSHIVRAALIHLDSLKDGEILEILETVLMAKSDPIVRKERCGLPILRKWDFDLFRLLRRFGLTRGRSIT